MSETKRHSLSLLCPTRGRPDRAGEFVDSVFATVDNPERIEILLYVDDDDPSRPEYERAFANRAGVKLFTGPAVGVPQAVNRLLPRTEAEILLTANDDQVYIDRGWDTRIDKEASARPDGIYCLWFNDGWESHNFCTFPVVSRRWVETLGYLQFPFFEHFFADAWIWMLAKSVERAVYIPDVLVEHRHWKTDKATRDATYERHATKDGDSRHARDRAVIDRFERYFHADVEALRSAMERP